MPRGDVPHIMAIWSPWQLSALMGFMGFPAGGRLRAGGVEALPKSAAAATPAPLGAGFKRKSVLPAQ